MDAPLASGGSVHGAAAAVCVRQVTGALRRYWGAGSLSRLRDRYVAQAKTGAALREPMKEEEEEDEQRANDANENSCNS